MSDIVVKRSSEFACKMWVKGSRVRSEVNVPDKSPVQRDMKRSVGHCMAYLCYVISSAIVGEN